MQQPRQMYQRGGIMEVAPRQGAIFGGLKKAVSSALGSAKKLLKSDLGKAALLTAGGFGLGGMGPLKGLAGLLPAKGAGKFLFSPIQGSGSFFGGLADKFSNMGAMGKFATTFGIGALGGGALAALEAAGVEDESQVRDIESLKSYLKQGYLQLNPDKTSQDAEAFAETNTTEYRADGGRIGFANGMPKEGIETLLPKPKPSEMMQGVDKTIQSIDNFAQLIAQSGSPSDMRGHMDLFSDFIQKNNVDAGPAFQYLKNRVKELKPGMERYIYISNEDMPVQKAMGGRIGFAFGNPEQNAMEASGIGGLPLNQNPAGVKELDLRDSGGFIPPVGVKEKADDIPAMLSNNEFVFTADAVRGMGDGDVEKGAQRMYDMMKKLEGGGRV
jgi:hypothetical protein